MSDRFTPLDLTRLVSFTLAELKKDRFFSVPRSLFFIPAKTDPFRINRYGKILHTPVGVAAGPHTQLSQNILAAWLCGARYIELKTVQVLDELKVTKPCIDMEDEGYNCEWSQELKLESSFREYFNAWITMHILNAELGFERDPGTLFNMSVGYDLKGILSPKVQQFMDRMGNCRAETEEAGRQLAQIYPALLSLDIPASVSNHVTLSTMHGCPPEEIEKIASYLLTERKMHTTVKLNPTLLGTKKVREIVNEKLAFSTDIPDEAFAHDLKYQDAFEMLERLQKIAAQCGLSFGVKLTNTLESLNNRDIFPPAEKMMYMSGRALHPVAVCLAEQLQRDFRGNLDISFSAGADCFNLPEVLACGMRPVTVCSDLLRPGGYGRLQQYFLVLRDAIEKERAASIDDFILNRAGIPGQGRDETAVKEAALANLRHYAGKVTDDPYYRKDPFASTSIKTERILEWFDCIHAPCTITCPANQEIPEYMRRTSEGDAAGAFSTVMRTNPFPSVTGMVCDHLCQTRCTRIHYDEPIRIREIKRFIAESAPPVIQKEVQTLVPPIRMAVIGAGPAGLSCAWFLRQAGCEVTVYEEKLIPGGMVSAAIPAFRLTGQAIEADIQRILASGVVVKEGYSVDRQRFTQLLADHHAVFLAAGAQRSAVLSLEGINAAGVLDPLQFLFQVRSGQSPFSGRKVVIIGGGNTAMDAARTALRLNSNEGSVTIVYRRTLREMPADRGEIRAALEEGAILMELVKPLKINSENGKITSLTCCRTVLSIKGKDGRQVPVDIPGSAFEIPCDILVPAIGQVHGFDFLAKEKLKVEPGHYQTEIPKLFIGGDALRGASTAINAIGDGRKAALEMLAAAGISYPPAPGHNGLFATDALFSRKATRQYSKVAAETMVRPPDGFNLISHTPEADEAREESARCLHCDTICHVCVSVCPNLANMGYTIEPVHYRLQKAVLMADGSIGFADGEHFSVEQPYQVMNIRDFCNECGNCTTFCPSSGYPFKDKPGLCLTVATLNHEGSGFYLSRFPDRDILIFKEKEYVRTLTATGDRFIYETDQVKAVLRADDFRLETVEFLTPCVKEFHFNFAAEMSIILKGARQIL